MVNKEILNVQKRNGRGTEPLNIEKIHEMVEYACEDISGVSSSQVERKGLIIQSMVFHTIGNFYMELLATI